MRLRPAEAVRGPAPHYTDNKMLKDVGLEMQHTLHRLRLASVCFREATDRNPADAEAWNWLANTLLNLEEHDAATQAFAAANSLQPSAAHLINQGVALQRNGRLREAVEAYDKGLAIDGNWPEAHLNKAYALQELGDHQQAANALMAALAIKPNWSRARAALGTLLSSAGQLPQATEHLQAAIRDDPLDVQQRLDLGQVLFSRGMYAEEQEVYKELVGVLGDNALAYSYWATSILSAYQLSIGYRSYGKVPEEQICIATTHFECTPRVRAMTRFECRCPRTRSTSPRPQVCLTRRWRWTRLAACATGSMATCSRTRTR